jgi:hypothetical protein
LIRQWTGHDPVIAAREAPIQKLERLVWGRHLRAVKNWPRQ